MGSNPTSGTNMTNLHDADITRLAGLGKRSRLIGRELGLNPGYVSRRLKALGLASTQKNQHAPCLAKSTVVFAASKGRLNDAAENYLRFLCDIGGHHYASPPPYESFDLLVDFGDGWKKIQVKSAQGKVFSLVRMRINSRVAKRVKYDATEVDYFFLFKADRRAWLIPFGLVTDKISCVPEVVFPGFEIKIAGVA